MCKEIYRREEFQAYLLRMRSEAAIRDSIGTMVESCLSEPVSVEQNREYTLNELPPNPTEIIGRTHNVELFMRLEHTDLIHKIDDTAGHLSLENWFDEMAEMHVPTA